MPVSRISRKRVVVTLPASAYQQIAVLAKKKRPLRPAMLAISFSVTWRRRIFPFILSGVSLITEDDHKLCGGIQRGACAPLCVVAGVGSIREGPHRKGPSLMRPFAYFSGEGKVGRGTGAEPPKSPGHGAGGPETTKRPPLCSGGLLVCVVCVLGGRNRIGCYPFADCDIKADL